MFSRTLGFRSLSKDRVNNPSIVTRSCVLPDDVLIEIFLRLPPQPICLLRASSVCKHWHSLIVGHKFLCHFQVFHGTPMLGIFTNSTRIPRFLPVGDPCDSVSAATAFSLPDLSWHVRSCLGSHVIFSSTGWAQFLLLNRMNGIRRLIQGPPDVHPSKNYGRVPECNAAVLCAAGHANRGGCHSCSFFIVCVFTVIRFAYATQYSSETRRWTRVASSSVQYDVDSRPSILVKEVLYWLLKSKYILAFELVTRRLYQIECPPETHDVYRRNLHIMKTEDGRLGLACLTKFNLHLWARETDAYGVEGWVQLKLVELDKLLPFKESTLLSTNNNLGGRPPVRILSLVEDDDLVFIWTITGVFAVHLKSMQFKKVFEADVSATFYPYAGFSISGALGIND